MSTVMSYLPIVGGWGIVGFGVGFAVKRIGKFLLVVAGAYLATLLYLNHSGFITINTDLGTLADRFAEFLTQRVGSFWTTAAVSIPVLGAFAAGMFLGARR